jgi:hypothetical protein
MPSSRRSGRNDGSSVLSTLPLSPWERGIQRWPTHDAFKIPVYVLEQLRARLAASDYITWDKSSRSYIVQRRAAEAQDGASSSQIGTAFDSIDERFVAFVTKYGLEKPPVSSSWSDALISFLKSETASEVMRSVSLRGALIGDASQIESYITALFIQESEKERRCLI